MTITKEYLEDAIADSNIKMQQYLTAANQESAKVTLCEKMILDLEIGIPVAETPSPEATAETQASAE